jgi:hypothetical protein
LVVAGVRDHGESGERRRQATHPAKAGWCTLGMSAAQPNRPVRVQVGGWFVAAARVDEVAWPPRVVEEPVEGFGEDVTGLLERVGVQLECHGRVGVAEPVADVDYRQACLRSSTACECRRS